jgi:hypothetical protein
VRDPVEQKLPCYKTKDFENIEVGKVAWLRDMTRLFCPKRPFLPSKCKHLEHPDQAFKFARSVVQAAAKRNTWSLGRFCQPRHEPYWGARCTQSMRSYRLLQLRVFCQCDINKCHVRKSSHRIFGVRLAPCIDLEDA